LGAFKRLQITGLATMAHGPRTPDLSAQYAAMRKLRFLASDWSGEARIYRNGETLELLQTEHAEYKLNGLLLLIEGIGRSKSDGKVALQALGIVSFDDATSSYRFRTFSDGRYLETEMKLTAGGRGLSWGFVLGEIRTSSLLRLDESGQWTERHEVMIGSQPPRRLMELTVSRTA
jgi:hypothetical protein